MLLITVVLITVMTMNNVHCALYAVLGAWPVGVLIGVLLSYVNIL